LPAGAVALTVVWAILAIGPVITAHRTVSTITLPVSPTVSSTKAGIGRYLAGFELKIYPLIGHFPLEIADLLLQALNNDGSNDYY
jgi:hypothetical protein